MEVMTPDQEANRDKLLAVLGVDDPKDFTIKVMEALGMVTLMLHWLRGMFNVLEHYGAVNLNDTARDNFHTLRNSLSEWETFMWGIVPPRALTTQIGVFRQNGYLDPEFEMLLRSDAWGRACDRPDTPEICKVLIRVLSEDKRDRPEKPGD